MSGGCPGCVLSIRHDSETSICQEVSATPFSVSSAEEILWSNDQVIFGALPSLLYSPLHYRSYRGLGPSLFLLLSQHSLTISGSPSITV